MSSDFVYQRRQENNVIRTSGLAEVFTDWQSDDERWIFLAAHDDDIVVGAGLLVQLAAMQGIESHAVITTDGHLGYCLEEHRENMIEIRKNETRESFAILGLPADRIHALGFPDCDLANWRGRRLADPGDKAAVAGFTGVQNAYTAILRELKPTRLFMPTIADYHPDHKMTNEEMCISLFHANVRIWPELGDPVAVPEVYEYANYCDFPEAPHLKITVNEELLEKKIKGVAAYKSQMQTVHALQNIRDSGPVEYFREIHWRLYSPAHYASLFPE
jgi:LmbE family N-acetylglucosaminyl deacetylase